MRLPAVALVLCCLLAGCRSPENRPSPSRGASLDGVADATGSVPYVDERFHFVFTPPAPLRSILVSDPGLSADHPNPNEITLFTAREAATPSGIAVSAERLGVATAADPAGAADGAAFVSRIAATFAKGDRFTVLRQTHGNTSSGWMLDELDYESAGRYVAVLTLPVKTPEGQFLIVFRCNAASRAALDGMTAAVRAARLT